jgi:pimeloyl-ACP methyl ester carboxylesterase
MDYPSSVHGLVFAAASVDPELEKVYWYQTAADFAFIRWLLPPAIRTTNKEILPLKTELRAMVPRWSELATFPTTIVHGDRDTLVPIGNADFIARQLPHATEHRLQGENHFLPWRQTSLLAEVTIDLLPQQPRNNEGSSDANTELGAPPRPK